MHPGKSAIVLDEIQACTDAYSALKPLSEDKRFDVICSGSFLGINLDDNDDGLSPLGYAKIVQMYPMDLRNIFGQWESTRISYLVYVPMFRT